MSRYMSNREMSEILCMLDLSDDVRDPLSRIIHGLAAAIKQGDIGGVVPDTSGCDCHRVLLSVFQRELDGK